MTPLDTLAAEGVLCVDCGTYLDGCGEAGRCPRCESAAALRGETFEGRRVVYISGGITGVENYKNAFDFAAAYLRSYGCVVLSPVEFAPKGSDTWDWERWMRYDLKVIQAHADAIYMLDGWEQSKGACMEMEYAKGLSIPVYFQAESRGKPCGFCTVYSERCEAG